SFIVVSGSVSCKKDKGTVPDMGYNYFPNQVGTFVVYDVDSFYYNSFTSHIDTFKFQLKEKIESTFLDNQNRPTLRLERYIRNYNPLVSYSSLPWTLRDVWTENRTVTTAEKVEENVRYIKLAFAVKEGQTWNGNAQNTNDPLNYSYQFFDLPRTIGGVAFDSVLQVNQQIESSIFFQKQYIEKYAKRTGLVYKQVIDVDSQPNPAFTPSQLATFNAIPILQRVTSGVQYTYIYNSSGTE
ncbi:MAG: hypothetical protein NTX97_07955, partial [Bacteroidetes bacterium]|nr:hypothetical protein [Bacteroidota bacterium]